MRTKLTLLAVLLTCAAAFTIGCVGKAMDTAALMVQSASDVMLEKAPLTEALLRADAVVDNPHYRVLAVHVDGLLLDMGLDGVRIAGNVEAQGEGDDQPLSDETKAKLRDFLLEDETLLDWVKELSATLQSSPAPATDTATESAQE